MTALARHTCDWPRVRLRILHAFSSPAPCLRATEICALRRALARREYDVDARLDVVVDALWRVLTASGRPRRRRA